MNRARPLAAAGLLLAALVMLPGCMSPRPFDEQAWRRQVAAEDPASLRAPHFDPNTSHYFNPWLPRGHSAWSLLRWRLSRNALPGAEGRAPKLPVVSNAAAYLKDPKAPDSITWAGHATYAIQLGGRVVVTDPMFADAIWWVVKRHAPPAFGTEAVPAGAVVVISHNHYDHLNEPSVRALAAKGAAFVCPLGLAGLLREWGARQVTELDWWQSATVRGVRITSLPVQHWSRRMGMSYDSTLWCGYLIERNGRRVFYGGDSGYFVGFKEFGRLYPGIDAALLGLGAYYPRWFMHYAHMDVAEAMRAFTEMGARYLVPTQWGVFGLGDEPATWPLKEVQDWLKVHPALRGRVEMLPVGGRLMLKSGVVEPKTGG